MRSMISSSERALARADFRRFWPLLFGYAVLWICALPLTLWSRRDYLSPRRPLEAMFSINSYLNGAASAAIILSACFAVLLAMALYAYLMNGRSVGLMHALPITRGRQFATHFAVGVAMFTVVHLAAALLTLPVQAALGAVDLRATWEWFASAELTSLFFFALATLCAMVTGWLLAIPVIFAGVNFLFAAFWLLFSATTQMFYWGYENAGWPAWVDWLTPLVRLYNAVSPKGPEDIVLNGVENGSRYYLQYVPATFWTALLIYTAVAVLFIVVAWLFCRARHSETAGDAIVFPWLRPIVLYVISLAGGMGLGLLLWAMFRRGTDVLGLLLCQILCGLVVYFGVQMLLHKSFRVFDRRGWLGAAALAAALVIIGLVVRFDAFGAQKYVPDADQIESATLSCRDIVVGGLEDPQGLEKLTAFHRAILDQGQPTGQEINDVISTPTSEYDGTQQYITFNFTYELKSGSSVRRTYTQIVRRDTPLYQIANDFYNDPAVKATSHSDRYSYVEIDPATITGGWFNNYRQDGQSVELTAAQTRQLYAAIQRYYDANRQQTVDILDDTAAQQRTTCFYLEFNYHDAEHDHTDSAGDGNSTVSVTETGDCFWNLDDLPADCTEVLDLLVSFGLAETTDQLLYD